VQIPRRMRVFIAALFLLGTSVAFTHGGSKLERVAAYDSACYRLNEWAASMGFQLQWDKKTGVVELTKPGMRLGFIVNSRKARLNTQTLLLSMPLVERVDTLLISAVDVQTTLNPLIAPQSGGGIVKTVCLDPGHGGRDTGKIDKYNLEKKYTLLLAREVATRLQLAGFKVVMTRTTDQSLELSDRPVIARRMGADLFISLHYNAASPGIRGVEVYCLSPAGVASSNDAGGHGSRESSPGNMQNSRNILLASELQKSILKTTGLEDRGLKRARFEVLREARMPAVLIEGGFMTDSMDAAKIYDPTFRKKMAQAIADAVGSYKQIVEKK
jgi:N-acetylmuramoyl-L-alanine amidase